VRQEIFRESDYNGIVVHTTSGLPTVLSIDTHKGCCEKFNVNASFPDGMTRDDFVGAMITDIRWGEERSDEEYDYHMAEIIMETTKGAMMLVVENEHNGYYPHNVIACFNHKVESFRL
jgi:hypothetical protein